MQLGRQSTSSLICQERKVLWLALACLYVRLFVCPLTYVKDYTSKCHILPVAFFWRRYNMLWISDFVDDVMFLDNGANGPESKTTRLF